MANVLVFYRSLHFQINQFRDALNADSRAIRINSYISEICELNPSNPIITPRLLLLKNAQINGMCVGAAPGPQDVLRIAYANVVPPGPGGMRGMQLMLQPSGVTPRPAALRTELRGPGSEMALPPPSHTMANARIGSAPVRAPMELDRGGGLLDDGGRSLLNKNSVPLQQIRSANGHADPFQTRPACARPSRSSCPMAMASAPIVAVRGREPSLPMGERR
ncbi:uncharacterized protein SCHCODRAFT_01104008 [Schizophyllum commune H4-8]|nr:uncharacterized protein SCHCODRAFT_01104008 [Schizophyllum commune H4-8]KAI5887587.1 hypothetical protein SCHCODRAFT_01104008 [Schizophyllum commune H4-8]